MRRLLYGISTALAAAFPSLSLHAGMNFGEPPAMPVMRRHVPAGHGKRFQAQWDAGKGQATILRITRQMRRAEQRKAMKRMYRGVVA